MTIALKLPVGIEDFQEIRRLGFYYVDKTMLIEQLLAKWGKVNLFTRPRRFGKSLNMSMLRYFFDIETDKTLFDGLYISRNKQLCEEYMGKFPVIFLSLKGVDGLTFSEARFCLAELTHETVSLSRLVDYPIVGLTEGTSSHDFYSRLFLSHDLPYNPDVEVETCGVE